MFESESFENFSNAWKARESYEFLSDVEFIEDGRGPSGAA
jgi:hypothetical protein